MLDLSSDHCSKAVFRETVILKSSCGRWPGLCTEVVSELYFPPRMGRPTLPVKSPKRLQGNRRRSAILRNGSSGGGSTSGASSSSSGGGVAANIKVAVRVRPENRREMAGNYANVVRLVKYHFFSAEESSICKIRFSGESH